MSSRANALLGSLRFRLTAWYCLMLLGTLVAAGHGLALVATTWHAGASTARVVPLTEPALVHRVEVLVLRQHAEEWEQLIARVRSM